MIHYHGAPAWTEDRGVLLFHGRHILISFADPRDLNTFVDVCHSFVLDNGAFTAWKTKQKLDYAGFARWIRDWYQHPAFDWALIPDVIDGDEQENDALLGWWLKKGVPDVGVPIWHLHESFDRLKRLTDKWPRIALGSSRRYATIGTNGWWDRMAETMRACCDAHGRPFRKLHGLRMLDPEIFRYVPLSSADSTGLSIGASFDMSWPAKYKPLSKLERGLILAQYLEHFTSAKRWSPDNLYNHAREAPARRAATKQMVRSLCP